MSFFFSHLRSGSAVCPCLEWSVCWSCHPWTLSSPLIGVSWNFPVLPTQLTPSTHPPPHRLLCTVTSKCLEAKVGLSSYSLIVKVILYSCFHGQLLTLPMVPFFKGPFLGLGSPLGRSRHSSSQSDLSGPTTNSSGLSFTACMSDFSLYVFHPYGAGKQKSAVTGLPPGPGPLGKWHKQKHCWTTHGALYTGTLFRYRGDSPSILHSSYFTTIWHIISCLLPFYLIPEVF